MLVSTGDWSLSCCIVRVQVDLTWLVPVLVPFTRLGNNCTTSGEGVKTRLTWLGLASARLYYTAPDRFSVSMFRAPVLLKHTLAWLGLSNTVWYTTYHSTISCTSSSKCFGARLGLAFPPTTNHSTNTKQCTTPRGTSSSIRWFDLLLAVLVQSLDLAWSRLGSAKSLAWLGSG